MVNLLVVKIINRTLSKNDMLNKSDQSRFPNATRNMIFAILLIFSLLSVTIILSYGHNPSYGFVPRSSTSATPSPTSPSPLTTTPTPLTTFPTSPRTLSPPSSSPTSILPPPLPPQVQPPPPSPLPSFSPPVSPVDAKGVVQGVGEINPMNSTSKGLKILVNLAVPSSGVGATIVNVTSGLGKFLSTNVDLTGKTGAVTINISILSRCNTQ